MVNILYSLIKKYWDLLLYLFFGFLTTVVNYLIYLPAYNLWGCSAAVSNSIAWCAAVLFSYATNKPFVFRSKDWSWKTVGPEFAKFVSCRFASGVLETVMLLLTVDILNWNGNIWKVIISVVAVILNYFCSKLIIFKKKQSKSTDSQCI